MSSSSGGGEPACSERAYGAGLLGLILLGAGTRFYRLGAWGLAGDELYTLHDSLSFSFSLFTRPLLFALNHYLVSPFFPLDEFGLRLLPAIFGVLSIPAIVWVGIRMVGRRAALFSGLFVVFSPWHLALSQEARYYSLVFFLASLSPAALWIGVQERSRGWLLLGAAVGIVAFFAHPTSLLPIGGFILWSLLYGVFWADDSRRAIILGGSVLVGAATLIVGVRLIDVWASLGQEWGLEGLSLLVSYVNRLGTGPTAACFGGLGLLWLSGRRSLTVFLTAAILVPAAVLAALGKVVSVRAAYLFATTPYAILGAGALVDHIVCGFEGRFRRLLVGGATAFLIVAPGLPWLVSHYRSGRGPDYRSAVEYVVPRADSVDMVLSDQPGVVRHYGPNLDSRPLYRRPARLDSLYSGLASSDGVLWVLPYVRSQGGFGIRSLGKAESWLRTHCRELERFGRVRIDHRRAWVPVWRCPPPPRSSEP